MSEEKEAIDYLKNDVVYWLDKGKDFVVIDIGENEKLHSILNLIDKQKKEIEELKKDRKDNMQVIYGGRRFGTEGMVLKDYISKDKIREKIKDIESYAFTSKEEKNQQDYAIERIRELLEEK